MLAALLPATRCGDSSYAVEEDGGVNKCLRDFLAWELLRYAASPLLLWSLLKSSI